MKKIISLLLAVVMLFSITACTHNDNPNSSETNPSEDATQPIEKPQTLTFREYDAPILDSFVYSHEDIGGYDISFTNTHFNFDIISIYAAVQNASFFEGSGHNLQFYTGEDAMYYHSDFPMYDLYSGVYCEIGGTEESPDMTISVDSITQTTYFNNPNAICLTITYNPDTEDYISKIQEYPYEIIATLLGEEFANFLVYAKDLDGLDYYKEESILPNDLSENVDAGNGGYMFCRTFEENQVTYEIFFHENNARGDQYLIGRAIENTTYESLPYKINDLISTNFGGTNPNEIYTFGNKVFASINPDYETVLVSSVYNEKVTKGDSVEYCVSFVVEIPDTYNFLNVAITYTMSEGEVIDSDIAWYLSNDRSVQITDEMDAETVVQLTTTDVNRLIEILKLILPDSEISVVKNDPKGGTYKYRINYTILGIEGSKTFSISSSKEHLEAEISFKNSEHNHNH